MIRRSIFAAVLAALLVPAVALGATKPAVTTGGTADLTFNGVTLKGQVDANGATTTYWFEYGTTQLYGAETAHATVTGTAPKAITAAVAGLAPATRYHYRLVAQNSQGIARGADRTFKTRNQPLGVSLAAYAEPGRAGCRTTLAGQLTGTNNGNRQVILQSQSVALHRRLPEHRQPGRHRRERELLLPGPLRARDDAVQGPHAGAAGGAEPDRRRRRRAARCART